MKHIILYGAGERGRAIHGYLESVGKSDVVYGFCDKRAREIGAVGRGGGEKPVWTLDELQSRSLDCLYCITPNSEGMVREIMKELSGCEIITIPELLDMVGVDRVKYNRDFCAFAHMNDMDHYFQSAEESLDVFWKEESPFYRMFRQLDLTDVIELACGRGRHVPKYMGNAGRVTLVDILQKNIDYCRERLKENSEIQYYKNDGYDLKELESDTYTALFTYDAMVHFEMLDVSSYLNDIFRVLKGGGRALFHHSNNHSDYKASFGTAVNGRSFMSKEVFAYLAYRAGFEILEQQVIDWGTPSLDCITLVEKPGSGGKYAES